MAAQNFDRPEYREVRQKDLSGGVNDYLNENVIKDTETPNALNVDFDRASVDTAQGSIKFNNQTAPSAAIRTKSLKGQQPLTVLSAPLQKVIAGSLDTRNIDVPMRGYGYLPYTQETDIGGDFFENRTSAAVTTVIASQYHFYARRGRSFEFNVSVRIPEHEKLFDVEVKGANAPAVPALPMIPPNGFDEALDETFIVLQKGGDRLAPMSWALGITNIGNGYGLKLAQQPRPTNYALVFMWYDNAQWGCVDPQKVKYNLTSGQNNTGAATQNATMAYRAVVIHRYVEPGKSYHIAVQLSRDSGTPADWNGTTHTAGTWNADGKFAVHVTDDYGNFTSHTYTDTASSSQVGLEVCRGPLDSLSYLCRYGIRFSGRDAMFLGLGMRFTPWDHAGFIPFGHDSACMRSGGMALTDRSAQTYATLLSTPTTGYVGVQHTSGNSYIDLPAADPYMQIGTGVGSRDPMAVADTTTANLYTVWTGLQYNLNALRGYRLVTGASYTGGSGARLTILDATALGQVNILDGADTSKFGNFGGSGAPNTCAVQCFRWNQRDLDIGNVRIYSTLRDYTSITTLNGIAVYTDVVTRTRRSLGMSLDLRDDLEPNVANLIAYWPCDDSGGAVLHEKVIGGLRHGFLCPMQNAIVPSGQRGSNMLFMSGEGEAMVLDLSENETFKTQIRRMLTQPDQGFGFEVSLVETEAFYGVYTREAASQFSDDSTLTSAIFMRPVGTPDLVQWDVKDSDTGRTSRPRQLLTLSHRAVLPENSNTPCEFAQGFGVEVASFSDSQDYNPSQPHALAPWYLPFSVGNLAMTNRYDKYAGWVGKRITIQVGIQNYNATADTYDVYIALSPKSTIKPVSGDPDDVEFSYWTDTEANSSGGTYNVQFLDGPQMRISKKDLERTVLTVGGRWDCKPKPSATKALGIHEISARLLVDEVRWFATTPAGALSSVTGQAITARNGKLQGVNCLPQRLLTDEDLRGSLGSGASTVTVTQGTRIVNVTSSSVANGSTAASSQQSVLGSYLYVDGDTRPVSVEETIAEPLSDFYYIDAVNASGSELTIATAYRGSGKTRAAAGAFRVVGYTAFEDDIQDSRLYIGKGKGYDPSVTTLDDVQLTQDLWANRAVVGGYWKLRIYSPFSIVSSEDVAPSWVRGVVNERRFVDDGVLGLYGFNERIYAGVRGSLYEVDDRWRQDGPSEELSTCLEFRAKDLYGRARQPLQSDRVEFDQVRSETFQVSSTDAYATVWDYWANLNGINEYQGVMWCGHKSYPLDSGAWRSVVSSTAAATAYGTTTVQDTTPWSLVGVLPGMWVQAGTVYGQVVSTSGSTITVSGWVSVPQITSTTVSSTLGQAVTPTAGTQAVVFVPGHKTQFQVRYNQGLPQIAFGSTGQVSAGVRPEKGLFVATADIVVSTDEWHHVRWVAPTITSGSQYLKVPLCYVNGKKVPVRVNASELSAPAGAWISTANLVSLAGNSAQNSTMAIGALRDSYSVADPSQSSFSSSLKVVQPARYTGWVHSLDGTLGRSTIYRKPWTGTDYSNFDPYSVTYQDPGSSTSFLIFDIDQGVGHKVRNEAAQSYGIIYSHPFISLTHSTGDYSNQWTFAENGSQVYATNGGRPVVVIDTDKKKTPYALESGVPAPNVELDFTTTRFPLFAYSSQTPTEQKDPLPAGKDVFIVNNIGNSYLEQNLGTAMTWSSGSFFYFKALWTPKETSGRINLFRRGSDANNGGPFIECVDGKLRYGWYDLAQKDEVYIETSDAVVTPGRLHYIHIRHRYPAKDVMWGNWRNAYFANGHYRRFTGAAGIGAAAVTVGDTLYGWNGANQGQYRVVKKGGSTFAGGFLVIEAVRINITEPNLLTSAGSQLRTAAGGGGDLVMEHTVAWPFTSVRPMPDMFVVQSFSNTRASTTNPYPRDPLEVTHADNYQWNQTVYGARTATTDAEERTYLSLTTNDGLTQRPTAVAVAGSTFKATGLVSVPWLTYSTIAATNEIEVNVSSIQEFGCFHWLQAVGCVFEFLDDSSTTAALRGKQYIITEVKDSGAAAADRLKQIEVVNLDGTTPSFAAGSGYGGVFTGRTLVKSSGFDTSDGPDITQTKIELFGNSEQTTFQPFNGKVHSFGYGVDAVASATDLAQTFETFDTSLDTVYATRASNDGMFTGMDRFQSPYNFNGAGIVGTLQYEASAQYIQVNGATWLVPTTFVTIQPNTQLEVNNTSTVTSTGGIESKCTWRYLQSAQKWLGKRFVAVGFYDPIQGIAGNPGPVLEVSPAGNDVANDAGPVAINLTNIPTGPDGCEVWIYASVADGNAATMYRVARLVNGTATYQVSFPEDQIVSGPPAEFVNDRPPRCEIVASSKGSMIYAALQSQPDGVAPSRPVSPGQVDFSKFFRIQGGSGDKITGAIEFDGLLVVAKRRLIASVEFVGGNFAVPQIVSSGVGCVSHSTLIAKDNTLLFLSDRGLQATMRRGVTNLNSPEYIGDNISTFVQFSVDRRYMDTAYATMNRKRSQYTCVVRTIDEDKQNYRFTCDLTQEGPVYSLYRLPNLTSVASVRTKDGQDEVLVGGTEEGFVVWLDRADTTAGLMGQDIVVFGQPTLTNFNPSTASAMSLSPGAYSNQTDYALEGMRGVTATYLDAEGVLREAVVLYSSYYWIQFESALEAAIPDSATVAFGVQKVHYETPWMDMGNAERRKLLCYLNLVFGREQAGEVVVRVYTDWDSTNVKAESTLDLTNAEQEVSLGAVEGNWFKMTLDSVDVSPGLRFTLSSIVWRLDDTDQV